MKSTMTLAQFRVIAKLIRAREPMVTAAKLVLLKDMRPADAARRVDRTPQSVNNSIRRFKDAYKLIQRAFK